MVQEYMTIGRTWIRPIRNPRWVERLLIVAVEAGLVGDPVADDAFAFELAVFLDSTRLVDMLFQKAFDGSLDGRALPESSVTKTDCEDEEFDEQDRDPLASTPLAELNPRRPLTAGNFPNVLAIIASKLGSPSVLEHSLTLGADPNHRGRHMSLLHHASKHGHVEIVRNLIAKGADVTAISRRDSQTALHIAAEYRQPYVLEELLRRFKAINESLDGFDDEGWTALHIACMFGFTDGARMLLENGAAASKLSTDWPKVAALHIAAERGHFDIVKVFVDDFGADVNVRDAYGATPLHAAAHAGNLEIVKFLVSEGAIVKIHDYTAKRRTPLDRAEEMVELRPEPKKSELRERAEVFS
ncbi:hypothetical protein HDU96_010347 [Phlyctochytrium bullatum]|nr:hypothetical protein HDU96_010347 [Phlyctochytrium bullatum]